jgi:charged multivesicular body protein 1
VFENLDVATGYVSDTLQSANATVTPPDQVDSLVRQIADEHNLAIEGEIGLAGTGAIGVPAQTNSEADMKSRFENLR